MASPIAHGVGRLSQIKKGTVPKPVPDQLGKSAL